MKNPISIAVLVAAIIAFLMWMLPVYHVWNAGMMGKAQLRKAQYNRQVKVVESKADYESAIWHQRRDTAQAHGIAWSNTIIGNSLINNQPYLVFRWIENLREISGKGQVIYVPGGMTPLPITEASRLNNLVSQPVQP